MIVHHADPAGRDAHAQPESPERHLLAVGQPDPQRGCEWSSLGVPSSCRPTSTTAMAFLRVYRRYVYQMGSGCY
jgi:hypothetical protein